MRNENCTLAQGKRIVSQKTVEKQKMMQKMNVKN